MLSGLRWYGHATVRIDTKGGSVMVDPYRLSKKDIVDYILITHSHYDHLAPDDLKKVRGDKTVMVAPKDCQKLLGKNMHVIAPGGRIELGNGIVVEAYPAYNLDKEFHSKAEGWVGYVVEFEGRRIYIAGDTDRIDEFKKIRCDVAFLPVGGTYTMNAQEAAAAVKDIDLKKAVPIHWGAIVGSRQDAERFVSLCGDKGVLMEPEKNV
jgi:L-ascorbate metabolism protein UlaG (beta-lactamase superfamily)